MGMLKSWLAGACATLAWTGALAEAHPFQAVLDKTCEQATSEQCSELKDAAAASPTLAHELDELAGSNLLTAIYVVKDSSASSLDGFLNASYGDRSMTFTENFLKHAVGEAASDLVMPDRLTPNHLVFAMGHLARHLRLAPEMAELEKTRIAQLRAESRDAADRHAPYDATPWALKGMQIRMEEEASAWIDGWNAMVEAAAVSNGGKPASLVQVSDMLSNFHYRPTIIQAISSKADKAVIDIRGMFARDDHNIAAFVAALKTSRRADVK